MSKWTVRDRNGYAIYCTEERWQHILESRPELEPLFDRFLETIRHWAAQTRPTDSK